MIRFLAARATPGVEEVDVNGYRRTISVDGRHGAIAVSHGDGPSALDLEIRFPDAREHPFITSQVARIFDLGADPATIAECLGGDASLRAPLARHPGIRLPGAWDGFELAVRAIIGQQISVKGATTISGRVAAMFGSPVAVAHGLDRLFPTPAQLVEAPVEGAGEIASRARAIRGLARAVMEGYVDFSAPADLESARAALTAISGIGDWTASYIAMRALGDHDAFPSGDLVLRRMAGGGTARELERRSAAWRPWRAYAVMLLWQEATDARAINSTS